MPRYDLSATETTELAAYIHFLRRSGRHRELSDPAAAASASGDAGVGETYFQKRCAACHAVRGDLAGLARRYPAPALRARVLRPIPETASSSDSRGRIAHERLLEQYADADVRNLLSYLDGATR